MYHHQAAISGGLEYTVLPLLGLLFLSRFRFAWHATQIQQRILRPFGQLIAEVSAGVYDPETISERLRRLETVQLTFAPNGLFIPSMTYARKPVTRPSPRRKCQKPESHIPGTTLIEGNLRLCGRVAGWIVQPLGL